MQPRLVKLVRPKVLIKRSYKKPRQEPVGRANTRSTEQRGLTTQIERMERQIAREERALEKIKEGVDND